YDSYGDFLDQYLKVHLVMKVRFLQLAADGAIVLLIVCLVWVQLQAQQRLDALAAGRFITNLRQAAEPSKDEDDNHEHAQVTQDWVDVVHQSLEAEEGHGVTRQGACGKDWVGALFATCG